MVVNLKKKYRYHVFGSEKASQWDVGPGWRFLWPVKLSCWFSSKFLVVLALLIRPVDHDPISLVLNSKFPFKDFDPAAPRGRSEWRGSGVKSDCGCRFPKNISLSEHFSQAIESPTNVLMDHCPRPPIRKRILDFNPTCHIFIGWYGILI